MPETGYIQLGARAKPPLENGEYKITVKQTTGENGDGTIPGCSIQDAEFSFVCGAEPFSLQQSQVYSSYPPVGSRGRFDLTLPHLVLTRRTLPWERVCVGTDGRHGESPWLMLLLLDEAEAPELAPQSMTCEAAFGGEHQSLYCPVQYAPEYAKENCMVADIPAPLFCEICPTYEEVTLLTHVKGVSRLNKPTELIPLGDWLSVLVANRYPASNTGDTGVKNTVYLVSCEHFLDFLQDASLRKAVSHEYDHVRIPVLYSWSFYSAKDDYDFKTTFEKLNPDSLRIPPLDALAEPASTLLDMGYAPVDHVMRDGGRTVSWFRGPFSPYPREPERANPALFSDHRLIYDPDMGMFDIGYAAAFSLGRQLALQSEAYASALNRWRHENKRQAGKAGEYGMIGEALGNHAAREAADAKELLLSATERLVETMLEGG